MWAIMQFYDGEIPTKSVISDLKSCLSGLNWPRSGKNSHFLALFWLVDRTLGIGWK